jgi:inorganic pyrophosphatase
MRLDAIAIGKNPPEDVNVIVEVAIGGEPVKYEMDKEANIGECQGSCHLNSVTIPPIDDAAVLAA